MEVNSSKTQLVRQQGPNPAPGQATSVATVAIQSGDSRIVIAVLRVSVMKWYVAGCRYQWTDAVRVIASFCMFYQDCGHFFSYCLGLNWRFWQQSLSVTFEKGLNKATDLSDMCVLPSHFLSYLLYNLFIFGCYFKSFSSCYKRYMTCFSQVNLVTWKYSYYLVKSKR